MILSNWVSMTRANSLQQLNKFSLPILLNAQSYKLRDNYGSNLHLKEFLIIIHKSNDGVLGSNIIMRTCIHCMKEEHIQPLTYVQLILIVVQGHIRQQRIGSFANIINMISLINFFKIVISLLVFLLLI